MANKPKGYDAHDTAKSGEDTFTLQAGDPYGALLTDLWAALMGDNPMAVEDEIYKITRQHKTEVACGNSFGRHQLERGKITKAREIAVAMRDQYKAGIDNAP